MERKEDTDCSLTDDEIFFGRLTLKEVKKRIFMDVHQKNLTRLASCEDKNYDDIKIIETSSQPNMLSTIDTGEVIVVESLKSTSDPLFNRNKQHTGPKLMSNPDCEDSFLELEEKVTEQCKSPYNCDKNLDNTLEFVDFILNHAQSQEKNIQDNNVIKQELGDHKNCKGDPAHTDENLSQTNIHNDEKSYKHHDNIEISICAPTTLTGNCDQIETISITNNPKPKVASAFNTPISNKKETSNIFKTPKMTLSSKKDAGGKITPSQSKTYQHIRSPIATYIRNCPQVPLVKDVHPKKPLPSTSFIPKLIKSTPEIKSDKENIALPSLAYRNAKKTLLIDVSKEKLPQSGWAQKLTGVPRKPVVLKHNHREAGKKPLSLQQQQEDSFQDLTLHQADVSVCTQKLAFQKL